MEKKHKRLLQQNTYYLTLNLDIEYNPVFLNDISSVFNSGHMEEIISCESNLAKVEKFLDILPKRGPKAFDGFINALTVSGQDVIKIVLLACLNKVKPQLTKAPDVKDSAEKVSSNFQQKLLLIINVNKYNDASNNRDGSDKDVNDIKSLFIDRLQYRLAVDVDEDASLTGQKIMDILGQFRKKNENLEKNSIVAVFIMCHGGQGHIYGSDKEPISTQAITNILNFGGERLFKAIIFSCCRGPVANINPSYSKSKPEVGNAPTSSAVTNSGDLNDQVDRGGNHVTSRGEPMSVNEMLQQDQTDDGAWHTARANNMVIIYSTQLDYLSNRVVEGDLAGTVFIQSLLSVIRKELHSSGKIRKNLRQLIPLLRPEMEILYPKFLQFPEVWEDYFNDVLFP